MRKYLITFPGLILCAVIFSFIFAKISFSKTSVHPGKTAIFEKLIRIHQVKKPPGPYDWMAQHPEPSQDFEQYIQQNPDLSQQKKRIIYVAKLGNFNKAQGKIIELTKQFISLYFDVPVRDAEEIPLSLVPKEAQRIHPPWGDPQILSTYVLEELLIPKKPDDAFGMIAFTSSDLWPGENWNFVFGQASIVDRVGVWSIYRNGDPKKNKKNFQLCLLRTMKTGAHEVGHMLGLHHCPYFECLMNGSNHQKESDDRPIHLCPVCLKKLQWAQNFNMKKRYEKLKDFYAKNNFPQQAEFMANSLKAMEQ